MADDVLYTPEEIAEKLKLSKYTIYEMIKRGELTAHRIGRSLRISDEQLHQYILRSRGIENLYDISIIENGDEKFAVINKLQIGVVTELTGNARISIKPDDLILSKTMITSSARNMHNGIVTEISVDSSKAKVKLDIGVPITALITKRSLTEMQIEVGQQLVVIFKANQVRVFK